MAKNVRTLDCRPEDVFEVLGNGWLYPAWVVGASRMRDVDETWPQPGAELHHSVGVWPALLDDTTVVEEWDPPRRMVMRAKGWPIGEARVTLRVRSYDGGCMVRIDEEPVDGPATLLPGLVTTPLLRWRNSETLHRLAYLAEGGAGRAH
ncbi:SRPBCC family protein [Microbacterium sp. CR_7]|uniref:SRPBCC family protein n=1 Tax=Microbacterium sp. CR_7 TaxID=3055792 RepID=UPI0035C12493